MNPLCVVMVDIEGGGSDRLRTYSNGGYLKGENTCLPFTFADPLIPLDSVPSPRILSMLQ